MAQAGDPTPKSSAPSPRPSETTPSLVSMERSATEGFSEASRSVRLRTAWPRLQRLCPPRSERIWLIGGAPGNFKTQTILNMALDMASLRQRVLYVTLEQGTGEIGMQSVARYSGVPTERLDLAYGPSRLELSEQENEKVANALSRLREVEMFLRVHGADRHGSSLDAVVKSACRSRFDAVFIDHLGMIDRGRGRELEAIPRAADMLRRLCRGEVVAGYRPFVCVTTPLSRKRDEDDHPMLSHLRGSGNLEYDADFVMVVQKRPQPEESTAPNIVDGFVLKNRQGRCPLVMQFEAQGSICFVRERQADPVPPSAWRGQEDDDDED